MVAIYVLVKSTISVEILKKPATNMFEQKLD